MTSWAILVAGFFGIAVFTSALFGWGRSVRRLAGLRSGTWPVTVALGFGAIIFVGGLLNLARLAYPVALDAIILIGLVIAMYEWHRDGFCGSLATWWPHRTSERVYLVCWGAVILAIMGFTIATQLAPRLYNPSDDFQMYFAHVMRMVETGTLYGSPLDTLGSQTLGAQAFLQGFIVGHFPIYFINGADAVFCLGLCLMLAGSIGLERPRLGAASLTGVVVVFFIHPEYVNVSSLFSTAALIMAIVITQLDPRERAPSPPWRGAIAPALFYAAACALKPTSFIFLFLQFIFWPIALGIATREWRAAFKTAWLIAAWSVFFILPWVLLYMPYYVFAIGHRLESPLTPVTAAAEVINLWSTARLFYGGSALAYTAAAVGPALCAVAAVISGSLKHASGPKREFIIQFCAVAAAAALSYFLVATVGPSYMETVSAVRYIIPVLIGVVPVLLGLGVLAWDDIEQSRASGTGTLISLGYGAILIALFFPAFLERSTLVLTRGSELAFLSSFPPQRLAVFTTFDDAFLRGSAADEIRFLQDKIPPGEKILAWMETPFLLDYRRNPIVDVNVGGINAPWAARPDTRYVLWQFAGYGIPSRQEYLNLTLSLGNMGRLFAARDLDFYNALHDLVSQSDVLFDEDGIAILRLKDR